jgi:acetyltransferase
MSAPARDPIRCFFEPDGVAVVGASRTAGKAGHHQMLNLARGYAGRVHAVNPNAREIGGRPCVASIAEVPDPVDLAIVLLPAPEVPRAVAACVARGVPAVLIQSAGFAEIGPEGQRLQDAVVAAARGTGTRVWGPNCNGLVNSARGLLASFVEIPVVRPGPVAFVTQTGIFAAALLNQMMEIEGFGVSKVATLGNQCDVTVADVLAYLADDRDTEVIALHLETVRDGARLMAACRDLARRKPIVALRGGDTDAGARASLTHTGSLAGDARVARGAFAQAGILAAGDFPELIDVARALGRWRAAGPGARVAILTTSGGAGVVAVDHVVRAGLEVARLAPHTEGRLAGLLPLVPGAANPVDVWPGMERAGTNPAVREIAGAVLADPGVDAAVFVFGAFSGGQDLDPGALGEVVARSGKPAAVWLYGGRRFLDPWARGFEAAGMPVFHDLRTAVAALGACHAHARHRHAAVRPAAGPPPPPLEDRLRASRALLEAVRRDGRRVLTEPESRRLLEPWGLRFPRQRLAQGEQAAAAAAAEIGGPVAVKLVSPDVTHKSDIGAVVLDVDSPEAARAAVRRVRAAAAAAAPGAAVHGVLVQEMVRGGREVLVGMTRTPSYGPAVVLGAGGVDVELLEDVAFRLPPLDADEVDRMVGETRVARLLSAHRGRPAADREALRRVVLALAALAAADLGIEQIDVNPLLVLDEGQGALAVDAVVVLETREA